MMPYPVGSLTDLFSTGFIESKRYIKKCIDLSGFFTSRKIK